MLSVESNNSGAFPRGALIELGSTLDESVPPSPKFMLIYGPDFVCNLWKVYRAVESANAVLVATIECASC